MDTTTMTAAGRIACACMFALGAGFGATQLWYQLALAFLYAFAVVPLALGVGSIIWPRRALTFWAAACGPLLAIPAALGLWRDGTVEAAGLPAFVSVIGLGATVCCGLPSYLALDDVRRSGPSGTPSGDET